MNQPLARAAAAASLLALAGGGALAQSSPWYLGVAQAVGHESNVYRLADGSALPAGVKSRSDTFFTTSLVGGLDQPIGRQRLSGSGSLRANRYQHNGQLDNNGWGLNLGLDWSTVERLSGNVTLGSDRSLRRFDPAYSGNSTARNIEDNNLLATTVRLGVVTRLTAEGTLSRRTVRFSDAAYDSSEYNQNAGSLGLRYRLGGATTVGLAWRESRVRYLRGNDPYDRRDLDLSASWNPSALTQLYARVSHSRTDHDQQPGRDFSGVTGELRGSTQASGKLKLSARLSRDTGQSYSTFDLQGLVGATEFNRTSTALRLAADYALSAKITLNASVDHARRDLNRALTDLTLDGRDRVTTLAVGARWTPLRPLLLGCDLSVLQGRAAHGSVVIGRDYDNTGLSCFGQFVLQ